MNEIPTWWLIVSALFFVANLVFFAALVFAVIKLIPAVQQMTVKISELTTKVDSVATRVEEVAGHMGETVGNVGQKAVGIMGSIELISQNASKQFERFSPLFVGALTAMRLVKALNEMRHGRSALDSTKKKTLEKKRAAGTKSQTRNRHKRFGIF